MGSPACCPRHSSCQVALLGWLRAVPAQFPKEAEHSSCLQARKLSAFCIFFYLLQGLELCASQRTQVLLQLGVQDFHGAIGHPNYLLCQRLHSPHICYLHFQELLCNPTHGLLLAGSSGRPACVTSSFLIVQLLPSLPLPCPIRLIHSLPHGGVYPAPQRGIGYPCLQQGGKAKSVEAGEL